MCGIAGLYKTKKTEEHAKIMVDVLSHRGPDAQEIWRNSYNSVFLGHARLSIVDIEGGNQPMTDVYGRYTIVFNGEIYGYKGLREKYNNYPYKTNSDTELLFAMLYKHGLEFVKFLPGMFAFVIYDSEKDELFGARDRFGEKPFYYTTAMGGFAFASEIKSLKSILSESLTFDLRSISSYFERLYVPVNKCIYQEINKLPPGFYFHLVGNNFSVKKYWSLPKKREDISFSDAINLINSKLVEAIRKQLVADVNVGTFLSGGLDSSLITAIAAKISSEKISTYSFGFTQSSIRNELIEARQHSINIGTNHTEFDEREFDLFDIFQRTQKYFDEPFADSSSIPMYIISNYASGYGKVILTGDGGDELFGGYSQWYSNVIFPEKKKKSQNQFGLKSVHQTIKQLINNRSSVRGQIGRTNKQQSNCLLLHEDNNVFFDVMRLKEMGLPLPYGYNISFQLENTLDDVFKCDLENYMVGDILVKTDTMSMANSLELRAPFLDVELAEFAISLPSDFKYKGYDNKLILRELIKKYYPHLELQKNKLGFGAPVEDWLKLKAFDEYRKYVRNDKTAPIYKYLSFNPVKGRLHLDNYRTWTLINFNAWLEHQK